MDVRRLLASGALSGPYAPRRPASRLLEHFMIALLVSSSALLLAYVCLTS